MTDSIWRDEDVIVQTAGVALEGNLYLPEDAEGLVIFAHGSGSSRFSPRNQQVARYLQDYGLGTLLFDLLTREENEIDQYTREFRFNIELLGERMTGTLDWLRQDGELSALSVGLFGASTGAAAALIAAAQRPRRVQAVVSRGGRPDLADPYLADVQAPTLLIVGGHDNTVIALNREAAAKLQCPYRIEIVPGATHLFEEPGKLEAACQLASSWFVDYLTGGD